MSYMNEKGYSLRKIEWKRTYKSAHGKMVQDFLIPALENSIFYRRVAGYFSSSVLTIAAAGIAKLLSKGGEMEMIVGADLSYNDVQAMNQGSLTINDYIRENFPSSLEDFDEITQFIMTKRYDALSWLISMGKLKIKIAILIDENNLVKENQESHIFHDKWGIFYDENGNFIGFMGSANETKEGWLKNHEKIHVYRSWNDEEKEYLMEDLDDFDSYWSDEEPGIKVYDVTDAINEKLIRYRSNSPPSKDPIEHPKVKEEIEKDEPSFNPSDKPGKISGVYNGLEFMDPEQFKCTIEAQILKNLPGIDHDWNMLLQTISFEPMRHQTYIAHEIFNNFPRGYLLCDEVGLGKTIEAGLAIKWLLLSGKIKRVLIIVPKNILKQWQEELREKFNLEFYIYDGRDLITPWGEPFTPLKSNPYNCANLILISSGLMMRDDRSKVLLESIPWDYVVFDEAHHIRRKASSSITAIGAAGKLLKFAEQIRFKTRALLLMTATPIQMRIEELFDLLKLLGLGGKWGIREFFQLYYEVLGIKPESRTFLEWDFLIQMARDFLTWGRTNEDQYAKELNLVDQTKKFAFDIKRIFLKKDDFNYYYESNKDDITFLRELSNELETLSPLRWYMFRNTRSQLREYDIHIAERQPEDVSIKMKSLERELYREVEEYIKEIYNKAEEKEKSAIGFTLAIYRRRLTSSFTAIKETLRKRKELLEKLERQKKEEISLDSSTLFGDDDIDEDLINEYNIDLTSDGIEPEENNSSIFQYDSEVMEKKKPKKKKNPLLVMAKGSFKEEIEHLEGFIKRISDYLTQEYESKFLELKRLLINANKEDAKRILVFTQYTDTLNYLKEILKQNPDFQELATYSGSGGELLKYDADTDKYFWEKGTKEFIKNWFFEKGSFKIMLCTDAASEGLNFHVCSWLINYDLPWNPMRVEQRIGRIDRVKQESDFLYVFNLLYDQTIEGRIYQKLWDRIRLFQRAVGPLAPILNVYQKAEQFAISEGDEQLTEEKIDRMLGNIQEETRIAEERHNFFLKLIRKRVKEDIDESESKEPFSPKNFYLNWLNSYLKLSIENKYSEIKEIKSYKNNIDHITLIMNGNSNRKLFIPDETRAISKNPVKSQVRDFNDEFLTINLSTKFEYDSIESGYFFTSHTTFFQNLMKNIALNRKRNIPILFSKELEKTENILQANVIVLIQLYDYPHSSQKILGIFSLDLKLNKINEVKIISNLDQLKIFINNNSNTLKDIGSFKNLIKSLLSSISDIKELIRVYLKHHKNEFELISQDNSNYMNYKEIDHNFKAIKETYKNQIKRLIQNWLLLEYFYEYPPNEWENLPDEIKIFNYLKNFYNIDEGKSFEAIINEFDLEEELEKIEIGNEIIKQNFNIYKNTRKYKIIKADQGRIRQNLIQIINSWLAEKEIIKMREFEIVKISKIFRPKIIPIGIILKSM